MGSGVETDRLNTLKVLVVEDEILIRKSVTLLVEMLDGTAVGETSYGEEAVKLAHKLKPDVIIMDIKLKDKTSGIDAAKRINGDFHPPIPVIFISANNFQDEVEQARIPNTLGYIQKPMKDAELAVYFDSLRS